MILNFAAVHDRNSQQLQAAADPLAKEGFRFKSIAVYGSPGDRLYAAVMLLRDVVVAQQAIWDLDSNTLQSAFNEMAGKGFAPTVISAAGTVKKPIFAAIFEPAPGGNISRTQFNIGQAAFDQENADARARGDILNSVAIYGGPGADRRYAAVWVPNTTAVKWAVFSDLTQDADQQIFDAMLAQRGRLSYTARSADGQYVSVYQDDSIGEWHAIGAANSAEYQEFVNEQVGKGFLPMCVQAGGTKSSKAIFTAIFAKGEDVLPRSFRVAGTSSAELKPLDKFMEEGMKKGGARASVLAVAHKGEIIHSRAYTWAESDYPDAKPENLFRVASVSKAITAIVVHQLIEGGVMTAEELVQPILKLTPPPDLSFSGPNFVDKIRVKHLLAHLSGLTHTDPAHTAVAAAFKHPGVLPVTAREYVSVALCDMKFPPGGPVPPGVDNYSNTGYLLLGLFIEAKTALSYEQVVRTFLLDPLGIKTAQVGHSLIEHRVAGEVRYHSQGFTVGKSVMTSDQPWVAEQYGVGDLHLGGPFGGWIISALDLAKIMAAFDRVPAKPIFKNKKTLQALYDCGVWEGTIPSQNGKDSQGADTFTRTKGGGFSGTLALVLHRDDNFSAAAIENYDIWPSDPGMSLSGIAGTWQNFQVNERLNLLAESPAYPFSLAKKWKLNANSFLADFIVESITKTGAFKGKIVEASRTDPIQGLWNKAERKLTFTRKTGKDAASVQAYTGYLMQGENRIAGTFEAFQGPGSKAPGQLGWTAWLPQSVSS